MLTLNLALFVHQHRVIPILFFYSNHSRSLTGDTRKIFFTHIVCSEPRAYPNFKLKFADSFGAEVNFHLLRVIFWP